MSNATCLGNLHLPFEMPYALLLWSFTDQQVGTRQEGPLVDQSPHRRSDGIPQLEIVAVGKRPLETSGRRIDQRTLEDKRRVSRRVPSKAFGKMPPSIINFPHRKLTSMLSARLDLKMQPAILQFQRQVLKTLWHDPLGIDFPCKNTNGKFGSHRILEMKTSPGVGSAATMSPQVSGIHRFYALIATAAMKLA